METIYGDQHLDQPTPRDKKMFEMTKSGMLTDVTLLGFRGSSLKAHKVVLTAASPYFDRELDALSYFLVHGNPDINILEAAVEFLYVGKVKVLPEDVEAVKKLISFFGVDCFSDLVPSDKTNVVAASSVQKNKENKEPKVVKKISKNDSKKAAPVKLEAPKRRQTTYVKTPNLKPAPKPIEKVPVLNENKRVTRSHKESCQMCPEKFKTQETLDAHVNRTHLSFKRRASHYNPY